MNITDFLERNSEEDIAIRIGGCLSLERLKLLTEELLKIEEDRTQQEEGCDQYWRFCR